MPISDLIIEGSKTLDAKTLPDYDRKSVVTASEIGKCVRGIWYSKRIDKARESSGFARRGGVMEEHAARALIERLGQENVLHTAVDGQIVLMHDTLRLAGTPDGFIRYPGIDEWWLVDFKSFDPRSNVSKFPKPEHVQQLKLNLAIAGVMQVPDVGRIAGGTLIYINASDYDDIRAFDYSGFDTVAAADAYAQDLFDKRAKRALSTRNPARLPREGKTTGECTHCPYKVECLGDEAELDGERKSARRGSALETALKRWLLCKADEDQAKGMKDEQAEIIKGELRKRNAPSLDLAGYRITLAKIAGRVSLDKPGIAAALKEAGKDIEAFEKRGNPYEQLSIKALD